jgi:hypothetical protein
MPDAMKRLRGELSRIPVRCAMRNERVVFGDEGASRTVLLARNIVIPEVRPLALCLNECEGNVVLWSHRVAVETLGKIIRRQRWNSVKEGFEIDVPNLGAIAQRFPKEEQALLVEFWRLYDALIRHFLSKK